MMLDLLVKDEFPVIWRHSQASSQIVDVLHLRRQLVNQRAQPCNGLQALAHSGGLPRGKMRSIAFQSLQIVAAYPRIGEAIVEREQQGGERAGYGKKLVESLARRLKAAGLKGFRRNDLWYMRQFYSAYPEKLHALRGELSWRHYRLLLKVESDAAREFYEAETVAGNWST